MEIQTLIIQEPYMQTHIDVHCHSTAAVGMLIIVMPNTRNQS